MHNTTINVLLKIQPIIFQSRGVSEERNLGMAQKIRWPMMPPLPRRQRYAVLMVLSCRRPLPPLHVAAMPTTAPQQYQHSLSLLPAAASLSCQRAITLSLFFSIKFDCCFAIPPSLPLYYAPIAISSQLQLLLPLPLRQSIH